MDISLVVITHGRSAAALCETVQMIVGEQLNLFSLDFEPGENVDSLLDKIKALPLLPHVLFLVDFLGGSPFNAAALYSQAGTQHEVVTGVNIPMLVNVLLEKEEIETVSILAKVAKQSGIEGIIQLSTDFVFAEIDGEDL